MTDEERATWAGVMHDYKQAHLIAKEVWPKETPPEVIQSATATIMIAHKERARGQQRSAGSEADAPVVPTECPKCHGALYDNRADKRTPRSPDFRCKDTGCDTPVWLKKKGSR